MPFFAVKAWYVYRKALSRLLRKTQDLSKCFFRQLSANVNDGGKLAENFESRPWGCGWPTTWWTINTRTNVHKWSRSVQGLIQFLWTLPAYLSLMYLGVRVCALPEGLPFMSIHLLHLNQPRIPMYRRAAPCVGWGSCLQPDLWLNTEDGKE